MDLLMHFEPFRVIHWDWNMDLYDNDYKNDSQLRVQMLSSELDVSVKTGIAIVMRSRLTTGKGIFCSYIGQQNIIIPKIKNLELGHMKKILYASVQECEQEFLERAKTTEFGFRFPLPLPARVKRLYKGVVDQL